MKRLLPISAVLLLLTLGLAGHLGCSAQAKKERHLKKAEAYFQKGDYDKAEIEYLNARRFEPTNALAIARLGIIYAEQGSVLKALPMLQYARGLAPTNTEVKLKFAQILQALGWRQEAYAEAGKLLGQDPKNGEALLLLARNAQGSNEVREAQGRVAAFRQQNGENGYFHLAASALLLRRGDRLTAETEAQSAVTADPKLYGAHLALAEFALSKSNLAAADAEFQQAAALAPVRSGVTIRQAEFKVMNQQKAEAQKILKGTTAKAPDFLGAWRFLALLALDDKKPEEALELINRVLFRDQINFDSLNLRARIQMARKQPAKAAQDLEGLITGVNGYANGWLKAVKAAQTNQAKVKYASAEEERKARAEQIKKDEAVLREIKLRFYPALAEAYYLGAMAYAAQTNQTKLVEWLNAALALEPTFAEARIALARYNLGRGLDPAGTIAELARFTGLMEQRVTEVEKQVGRTNVLADPRGRKFVGQYYQTALFLADVYAGQGRFEEAANTYRKLMQENPANPALHFGLGLALRQQRKLPEARAAFEQVLKLDPGSPQALMQLTFMDIAATNQAAAFQRLQTEIAQKPKVSQLYYLQGLVLASTSNTLDQAEAPLRKCLELDENNTPAYSMLARIYLGKRQLKDAAEQLATVLAKDPRDATAAMLLADVYKTMKTDDKAREVYEKLLVQRPNFLPAMNNLAYHYAEKMNQLDKAYQLSSRAYTLATTNAIIADTHGWILYRRGDYPQALALIQESASHLTGMAEIQYHLGMAYYMTGQPEPARTALLQAVNDPQDFPGKDEARKSLALLQAPAQSAEQLEQTVQNNPKDLVALIRLGDLYLKQSQTKKAADTFEKALGVNPKAVTPLVELARLYAGPLNNRDKAMDYAKKAREQSPANPQILHLLGQLAFQSGDIGGAYNHLQECQRVEPGNVQVNYDLAWAAYGLGKLDEAKQGMEQAQNAPNQPNLNNAAKWFLSLLGHYENPQNLASIEPQVNEALKGDSNYVPGLLIAGLLQSQRGQTKEAVQTFEKILTRFPQFPPAQRALALLYSNDPAQEKRALDLAMKARVSMPEDPALSKVIGKLYHNRKDFLSAVNFLKNCLSATPSDAEALYYLGSSYLQLKDKVKAKAALQQALAAGLKAPLDAEAKRLLGTL